MAISCNPPTRGSLDHSLTKRGLSRRGFLKLATAATAGFGFPLTFARDLATALTQDERLGLLWLSFQGCGGDSAALFRVANPVFTELILESLSLDYHPMLTVVAEGWQKREISATLDGYSDSGAFIAVIEGAVPQEGGPCAIGGLTAMNWATVLCANSLATLCIGTCASFGGLPAAAPNPTGARGAGGRLAALGNVPLVNLPGCPANAANIAATLSYLLTYRELPELDELRRPRFAYGESVHQRCERRPLSEQGKQVRVWGDAGHRQGWCLEEMGCKGPRTRNNCPTVRYNDGVAWPVAVGHGCVGCSEPGFWDDLTPLYRTTAVEPDGGSSSSGDDDDGGCCFLRSLGQS